MFKFLKKPAAEKNSAEENTQHGIFLRIRTGLAKTRAHLGEGLLRLFAGKKTLDADLIEQLETLLLTADVGVTATEKLVNGLIQKLDRSELTETSTVLAALKSEMIALLAPCEQPLILPENRPFVILMAGINGAGKTTTIGKLAHYYLQSGKKILLAAGDTFRAAAIEQLQAWGNRNAVPVIAQAEGTDPAAVIHDAMTAAQSKQADLLIADTAGRLHTQSHLMEELKKIKRTLRKLDPAAPHEILLVIDAGNGQNALHQAMAFHEALGVTGLILTKLDGTAKGGILFAIAQTLALPVRFIGTGESLDDLKPFAAKNFVDALFDD